VTTFEGLGMRRRYRLGAPVIAGLVLFSPLSIARPADAGVSFDFLFHADSATSDDQFFLNVAVQHYGYGRADLEPVLPRIRSVELDLPVVLFVAQESRRPVNEIVGLRERGLSWNEVFVRTGVPCDRLFVGVDRDPGPPYGKAWGYWKKHPRDSRLRDEDIRSFVVLQLGHRFTGLSPYDLARERAAGRPVEYMVVEKRGHGHKGKEPPGQAKKGHGKQHGQEGQDDDDHHDHDDHHHR
jgi:hypothetical protein